MAFAKPSLAASYSLMQENALNRMCASLVNADNCRRFRGFPEAYCHSYGLTREETHAVTDLDISRLLDLGGSVERIGQLTAVFSLDIAQLWTEQTGLDAEELHRKHAPHKVMSLF